MSGGRKLKGEGTKGDEERKEEEEEEKGARRATTTRAIGHEEGGSDDNDGVDDRAECGDDEDEDWEVEGTEGAYSSSCSSLP